MQQLAAHAMDKQVELLPLPLSSSLMHRMQLRAAVHPGAPTPSSTPLPKAGRAVVPAGGGRAGRGAPAQPFAAAGRVGLAGAAGMWVVTPSKLPGSKMLRVTCSANQLPRHCLLSFLRMQDRLQEELSMDQSEDDPWGA